MSDPKYITEWREEQRARWRKNKIRQRERRNALNLTSKGRIPQRTLRGAHKRQAETKSDSELDAIALRDPSVSFGRAALAKARGESQ